MKAVCSLVSPSVMRLGGFDCCLRTFAPWLRGIGRVADGFVVKICVVGWDSLRDIVGLCLVVLGRGLSQGVSGLGIQGICGWVGGFWGQIFIFGVCSADWACVLVEIVEWLSLAGMKCALLDFLSCAFFCVRESRCCIVLFD
jgi:hypothetical protein